MPAEEDLYAMYRPQPRPAGRRLLVGVVLLLFIALLSATAWYFVRERGAAPVTVSDSNAAVAVGSQGTSASQPSGTAATPELVENRVLDLEQRVMRISVAAQAASGYANRAEAIMVAFAARRALDSGAALGYIEGQLRVLFEAGQPKAVATIINAANDPVTLNKLRAGLEDINLLVAKGDPQESWWSATKRTLGSLVVVRRAGTPTPAPDQRIARARRAVESGQIEAAITELAALPAQPAITQWLDQARRYNEAHRALDVIEAAAILEPRTAPMVTAPAQPAPATENPPAPSPETLERPAN